MSTGLLRRLVEVLREASSDASVDAVVVTGSGGCFSSGADVSEDLDAPGARVRMGLFCSLYELVVAFPLPTVAAISGWCIGGGAELAAACDLRVGDQTAAIRFPGATFGVPAGAARLPLLVGLSHAKDLLMTARTVGAAEAHRMGFLNRLVPQRGPRAGHLTVAERTISGQELLGEAASLAAAMAANPGAMIQKRALDEATGLSGRVRRESRALRRWQEGAEGPGGGLIR